MSSVNADHAWEAVLSRDRRCDGRFVYAVSSTHVYCRPSCPSRRPIRRNRQRRPDIAPAYAVGHSCLLAPRQMSRFNERDAIWMSIQTSQSRFDG